RSICILAIALTPVSFSQSYLTTTVAGSSRLLDGRPGNTVPLRYPYGVTQDSSGNVYFADNQDQRIRRVDSNGVITTIAGNGQTGFSGDGGPATSAKLNSPQAVKLDGKGNLFIADYNNNRIRKVVLSTGVITTIAGNGSFRFSGDGQNAVGAGLDPFDI